MSSTPLIEMENAIANMVRKEQFTTYQTYRTVFQGWSAKGELEWDTTTGKLRRYWLTIVNPKSPHREGNIDGRSNKLFEEVKRFTVSFSGFGAMELDEATTHLDTLNVSLGIAKELQRRLDAGELPMPQIDEADKTINLMNV